MHGANDRRRVELRGHVDELRDVVDGAAALARIRIGETQLVLHPPCPGAKRRNGQLVVREQRLDLGHVYGRRLMKEQFDGIETQFRSASAGVGKIVRKDEWPAAHFRHERNGDSRTNHRRARLVIRARVRQEAC